MRRMRWSSYGRGLALGLVLAALALPTSAGSSGRTATARQGGVEKHDYFDPHNHITGILPAEAFANMPVFIDRFTNSKAEIKKEDLEKLYGVLIKWQEQTGSKLNDRPYSPEQRYGLGGRGTMLVYPQPGSKEELLEAIERVLTSTPWTEFDSAYKFRGDPVEEQMPGGNGRSPVEAHMLREHFGGDAGIAAASLCKATVLELARTDIQMSEQSMNFIGGWGPIKDGTSKRLEAIRCYMTLPGTYDVQEALKVMKRPTPVVKILLMTHTAQLAATGADQKYFSEWSRSKTAPAACEAQPLPTVFYTAPETVKQGLLGLDAKDQPLVSPGERTAFYDAVVGLDTAGPETDCFTDPGMDVYESLVKAVYDAAVERHKHGWKGKLLVHTHAGEGMNVYYAPESKQNWTFAGLFRELIKAPLTNRDAAKGNIGKVLGAIARIRKDETRFPKLDKYVVFRLGHVTRATPEQAALMSELGVEADVNLESNLATGAYSIDDMPIGRPAVEAILKPYLEDEKQNLEVNKLRHLLIPDPSVQERVGQILGNHSLKYLLEARVRVILGTDGGGIEHSSISRAYELAEQLIGYWKSNDPQFRKKAGDVTVQTLLDNAEWHVKQMSGADASADAKGGSHAR